MSKTLKIQGYNFPMEDKQDRHFSVSVTGQTFTIYFGMSELPKEKAELWNTKGYKNINAIAYALKDQTGTVYRTQFYKSTWYTLMNSPACIVIYTARLNDDQFGIIKFALTHGIKVAVEDLYSGIKAVYEPVANIFTMDIFRKFKCETFDASILDHKNEILIYRKRQALAEARKEAMRPIWESVNIEIEDLLEYYSKEKLETYNDRLIKADRYRTQEILDAAGASIRFFVYNEYTGITGDSDLDKPEIMDEIIKLVSVWAPAFEIDIKLNNSIMTSDLVQPRKWLKDTTEKAYFKQVQRARRALRPDDLHKIIEAYIQIQFYLEKLDIHYVPADDTSASYYTYNMDYEYLLSDRYYICDECGHPVNKTAEECGYCSASNPEIDPEWESYNTTNEFKEYEMEEM